MRCEWKQVKLGDIATVKGGKRLPKNVNLINTPNTHPYIRVRDINVRVTLELNDSFLYVDDETQKGISRYIVNSDDIVISIVGTIGLVAKIGKTLDGANLTENCVKITNLQNIDKEYLFYYLKSVFGQQEIMRGIVGAVQQKLPIKNIQEIIIKCPELIEQKKIAAILSALDEKIAINRAINDNLEQQAIAIFRQYFIDFEPYGGAVPSDWVEVSLDDVCIRITDGSHYSPTDSPNSPYPMYSVKDMETYGFNSSACKHITEEEFCKMQKGDCVPLLNDILVAKDGSYLKEIFICSEEKDEAILSSIAIFRPDTSVIMPEILLYLLKQPSIRKDVGDNYVSGSALPRIVLKDFKKYRFMLPPMNEQLKVASVLHVIRMQTKENIDEIHRLSSIRNTLLPKLMSGELDVSAVEL